MDVEEVLKASVALIVTSIIAWTGISVLISLHEAFRSLTGVYGDRIFIIAVLALIALVAAAAAAVKKAASQ